MTISPTSGATDAGGSVGPEFFREIRRRDLDDYRRLLREGFSGGPAQEQDLDAILAAARLYARLYFLLKPMGVLGCLPTLVRRIFVCERDGRAVAALAVRRQGHRRGPLYLGHLVVDEAYRRQGIASRLLRHVEQKMLGDRDGLILTLVREENTPQIRNREKAGFNVCARQAHFSLDLEPGGDAATDSPPPPDGATSAHPRRREVDALRRQGSTASLREILEQRDREPVAARTLGMWCSRRTLWCGGYRTQDRLLAGGILYYHRLTRRHELVLAADDDAVDLARDLLIRAVDRARTDGGAVLEATCYDFQSVATSALAAQGFAPGPWRVLMAKRWPPDDVPDRTPLSPCDGPVE